MNKIDKSSPDANVLFDYLSITFPVDYSEDIYREHNDISIQSLFVNNHFQELVSLLNLEIEQFTDEGKIQRYDKMITYGEHIHFKFNGPLNKNDYPTHSLELKGEGCREAERLGVNWFELFKYVYDMELSISTLHIACDLFHDKYFTIEQLLKKANNKEYVSFSKKFSYIQSSDHETKSGLSLYFGRRDDNQINIYDKKNERYYKGYEVDTNTWIRFEIRLKSSKSKDFLQHYIAYGHENLASLYSDILSGMLEFKKAGKYNQRNNYKNDPWWSWERFIKSSHKIKLVNQAKLESNLTRKKEWLLDSAGKGLLEYFTSITADEYQEFINELQERKLSKIDYKSLERINMYRMQKGLKPYKDLDEYKEYVIENGIIPHERIKDEV